MRLLLPLAATWLSSVALASETLEAALMENDECQASGGDDEGCTLSALQLRGAKQTQDEESACSPQGQWCGDNYPQKDCCGNNHCARAGGIFKCQPGGAQTTTGWPQPDRRRTRPPAGPRRRSYPRRRSRPPAERRRRRQSPNQCKQVGQVCGGLGQPVQSCCGNAKCQKLYGGDGTMKCVKESSGGGGQCKQVGQVCGGPGQWTQSCCGNAKCQKLFGGDGTMKCVKENFNQCVQPDQKCGGPGLQTQTCCRGRCKAEWYNPYGSKTCKV